MSTSGIRGILPEGWREPKGYTNGMLAPSGSRMLFVAGQVGWGTQEKDTKERIVSPRLADQFEQALANVAAVVRAAGGRPEHVLRLTFFVIDKNEYRRDLEAIGEGFRRVFGRHYPACTLVEVRALLEDGAKVEIEATAAIPPRKNRRPPEEDRR